MVCWSCYKRHNVNCLRTYFFVCFARYCGFSSLFFVINLFKCAFLKGTRKKIVQMKCFIKVDFKYRLSEKKSAFEFCKSTRRNAVAIIAVWSREKKLQKYYYSYLCFIKLANDFSSYSKYIKYVYI